MMEEEVLQGKEGGEDRKKGVEKNTVTSRGTQRDTAKRKGMWVKKEKKTSTYGERTAVKNNSLLWVDTRDSLPGNKRENTTHFQKRENCREQARGAGHHRGEVE